MKIKLISILLFLFFVNSNCYGFLLRVDDKEILELKPGKDEIVLDSMRGMNLLKKSNLTSTGLKVMNQLQFQMNLGACGVASMASVLNAMEFKQRPIPINLMALYNNTRLAYQFSTQQELVYNTCVRKIVDAKVYGFSMDEMAKMFNCMKLKTKTYYASEFKNDQPKFIKTLQKILNTEHNYVIANIVRPGLEELGGGHFSPLGFATEDDRFLFLDVSKYKYPFVFVRGKDLFKSMNTFDEATKKTRGFLVVNYKN